MARKQQVVVVYMTAKDRSEARKIGRIIVNERLVACVNIIPRVQSLYWWQGKVRNESEVAVIAKTRAVLVKKLVDRVKSVHSYSVPCVVALPILSGNPDYLEWVADETKARRG